MFLARTSSSSTINMPRAMRSSPHRERQLHPSAMTRATLNSDFSGVPFDDALRQREAKSQAAGFRGEQRSEYLARNVLWNAAAGILDRDRDVICPARPTFDAK